MSREKVVSRWVGALFLTGVLAYAVGSELVESVMASSPTLAEVAANITELKIGAVLMILNSVSVIAMGVLIFSLFRRNNESIALAYLCSRIFESMLIFLGTIGFLALAELSQDPTTISIGNSPDLNPLIMIVTKIHDATYPIAMIVLGLGSMAFCYLLYATQSVPRWLSVYGFIGYAFLFFGSLLAIFNMGSGVIFSIPVGLFEMIFAAWLLVKGF